MSRGIVGLILFAIGFLALGIIVGSYLTPKVNKQMDNIEKSITHGPRSEPNELHQINNVELIIKRINDGTRCAIVNSRTQYSAVGVSCDWGRNDVIIEDTKAAFDYYNDDRLSSGGGKRPY
jgi:hypothetical protein